MEDKKKRLKDGQLQAATAVGLEEIVSRYGSANAEYIKGYTGVDNETGQVFAKGLKKVSQGKINPEFHEQNIKQQAGYSAEIATTSRDNAEAIIAKSKIRTSRSDDLPQYGKNHPVVDRVKILDGEIIAGTETQMKFVGNRDQLFKKIAQEDGKFARYRGVKLEIPSEQFEGAADYCLDQAKRLREQAEKAAAKGRNEIAEKLLNEADNYEKLADNIVDSGMSTEEAIFYREHPELATAADIARTSHRAGLDGAKTGAVIGAAVSTIQNIFQIATENKGYKDAAVDVVKDSSKAAVGGYALSFTSSAVKSYMQQSGSQVLRAISKTNLPAIIVSSCASLALSVKRLVNSEIDEAQFLAEIGEKGSGMLSSGMMAAVGQIAIPIPVVGAVIGGLIGYTLSSFFYSSALQAAQAKKLSAERLERIRKIESESRKILYSERKQLSDFFGREIPALQEESRRFFDAIGSVNVSSDFIAESINNFATLLGKNLEFQTQSEFDSFMNSDESLKL